MDGWIIDTGPFPTDRTHTHTRARAYVQYLKQILQHVYVCGRSDTRSSLVHISYTQQSGNAYSLLTLPNPRRLAVPTKWIAKPTSQPDPTSQNRSWDQLIHLTLSYICSRCSIIDHFTYKQQSSIAQLQSFFKNRILKQLQLAAISDPGDRYPLEVQRTHTPRI